MALEESVEGSERLESNGIEAWIDKNLKGHLASLGKITIDYRPDDRGGGGYLVTVGQHDCAGECNC
jgi:hypothetical protein